MIPLSYWESLGFDEEYAEAMVTFQQNLKRITDLLCLANMCYCSYLKLSPKDRNNWPSDVMILHDKKLFPMWKSFTEALTDYPREIIEDFCIAKIQLPKELLEILAPALSTKKLKAIHLENNDFGSDGIIFATQLLTENRELELLELNENRIYGLDAVACFSKEIRNHLNLVTLKLTSCDIKDDADTLQVIINSCTNLSNVHLDNNHIGSHGAKIISHFLEKNPSMESLNLDGNNFNDEDAIIFGQALRSNTNLLLLHLNGNNITSSGELALFESILDLSSLEAIIGSNHTCWLSPSGIMKPILNSNSYNRPYVGSQMSTQRKVWHAIFFSNTNAIRINYLFGLPLQCMPFVLGLFQKRGMYEDVNFSLTMLFEVVRNWRMPELFVRAAGLRRSTRKRKTRFESLKF